MKNLKSNLSVMSASAFVLMMMPVVTHAKGITGLLNSVSGWLQLLVPMMMTLGVVAFFWGLVKYLLGAGAEGKSEGLKIMMYGILAVFVMASLGGIVALLKDTADIKDAKLRAPTICSGPNCSS